MAANQALVVFIYLLLYDNISWEIVPGNCCCIDDSTSSISLLVGLIKDLYFFFCSRNCIVALLKMLSTGFERRFLTKESMRLYFLNWSRIGKTNCSPAKQSTLWPILLKLLSKANCNKVSNIDYETLSCMKKGSSLPSKAGQQASSTAPANNSTPQQAAPAAKQPGSWVYRYIEYCIIINCFLYFLWSSSSSPNPSDYP
jgi:hypothetical protein